MDEKVDGVEESVGIGLDPVGTILCTVSTISNVPDKYLLANGASLRYEDYPELFGVIGYAYGSTISSDLDSVLVLDKVYDFESNAITLNNLKYIIHQPGVGYLRIDPSAATVTVYRPYQSREVISLGVAADAVNMLVPHVRHKKCLIVGWGKLGVINFESDSPSVTIGSANIGGYGIYSNPYSFTSRINSSANDGWICYGRVSTTSLTSAYRHKWPFYDINPEVTLDSPELYTITVTVDKQYSSMTPVMFGSLTSAQNAGEITFGLFSGSGLYPVNLSMYNNGGSTEKWSSTSGAKIYGSYSSSISFYSGSIADPSNSYLSIRMAQQGRLVICNPLKTFNDCQIFGGDIVWNYPTDASDVDKGVMLSFLSSYSAPGCHIHLVGMVKKPNDLSQTISILVSDSRSINSNVIKHARDVPCDLILPMTSLSHVENGRDFPTFISGKSIIDVKDIVKFKLPTISISNARCLIKSK